MRTIRLRLFPLACLAALVLAGCAHRVPGPRAIATLIPTAGNTVSGRITLVQVGERVHMNGIVQGLKPNGLHGFHVHETGDCTRDDAMSAGGHFNPGGQPHGRADREPHHAGDLPSVQADASGNAVFDFETGAIRLDAGPTGVIGRALIIHRDRDDYTTQPAGNSGPRVACAVIVRS